MAEAAPADEVTPVPPVADDAAAEEEEEEEEEQHANEGMLEPTGRRYQESGSGQHMCLA